MTQPKNLDKVTKVISRKAANMSRFMNSPIGKSIVRILEQEFPGGIGKNPYDTYRREGNREVLEYMKQLQRVHKKLEGDLE